MALTFSIRPHDTRFFFFFKFGFFWPDITLFLLSLKGN